MIKRKTKIIATLGPSSNTGEMIKNLASAGVDIFRLNFSHGDIESHIEIAKTIRSIASETETSLEIMMDLQGPKIRVGTFQNVSVIIKSGDYFELDLDPTPGSKHRVFLPHPEIFTCVKEGTQLLLDDGKLKLLITNVSKNTIKTMVLTGGKISDRKGINIPDALIPISAITPKDKEVLKYQNEIQPDFIAISFVQHYSDIEQARELIGENIKIISKIEKPLAASDNLDEIIGISDIIMIARGDLGVEIPFEKIPGIQRKIASKCRNTNTPFIVATQALESMITTPVPTRAEVTDVDNSVRQGAFAVMLSAESASGQYPIEAVTTMDRIVRNSERELLCIQPQDIQPSDL